MFRGRMKSFWGVCSTPFSLASSVSSFLKADTKDFGSEDARLVFMCRKALHFIVRNWLVELGVPGYFDPGKFFNNPKQIQDYKNKFGSPR